MDALEADAVPHDLVFVDLETTGGNAAHHRITEIGIVRVHCDAVVEEWSTLVNPDCLIPSYIQSFTGITNEMVQGAPRFAEIARIVLEKLCASTDPVAGTEQPVFAPTTHASTIRSCAPNSGGPASLSQLPCCARSSCRGVCFPSTRGIASTR